MFLGVSFYTEEAAFVWDLSSRQLLARLGSAAYGLAVTDPLIEQYAEILQLGTHALDAAGVAVGGRTLLCVSLGEPLFGEYVHGDCFKLVAGVISVS